jgi:hypothetical protein
MQPFTKTITMTVKHLPYWHPIRHLSRNPSFDANNDWLYDLLVISKTRKPSPWSKAKAHVRSLFANSLTGGRISE